jgi:hypothetical protein
MTAHNRPYLVFESLIETFSDWLKHRGRLNEMRQLDTSAFNGIARELGISRFDLEALVHRRPGAADELAKMLRTLGIDENGLARTEPLVLRDMQRVCALCEHKRQCHRDLAAGTSAAHYQEYCPNAPTIDGLGEPAKV